MRSSLVVTVVGPDRPGIVESIASAVTARRGNWVESKMARLAGQFAGVLLVDVPREEREALAVDLRGLTSRDLQLTITAADTEEGGSGSTAAAASPVLRFTLLGHDRPGVVRDVARVLAQRGVNVTDLETDVRSAPMSGEPLFRATVEATLPAAADESSLRAEIERVADGLAMDVTFD